VAAQQLNRPRLTRNPPRAQPVPASARRGPDPLAQKRAETYAATKAGGVIGVDRHSGRVRWRIDLPGPTWSSPWSSTRLLQGDCDGMLHAYDVSDESRRPRELWTVKLEGCIEATPAVWKGKIFLGTRGGAMYAIGDRRQ
jgi:outer membrane protein assembly factor BamB